MGAATLSCGNDKPDPRTAVDVDDPGTMAPKRGGGGPAIHAEVGALDPEQVKATFTEAMGDLSSCLDEGRAELEWLAGEIRVFLRIANDGSVRYSFPMRSTFGHRATEQCILATLSERSWPQPQGGEEGETTQSFAIDAEGRPAVQLEPSVLGANASKLGDKLQRCRDDAGTAGLSVTLYINPDGEVIAAGAAVDDDKGNDAIPCALDAARSLRFGSPGSWPGKTTIRAGS